MPWLKNLSLAWPIGVTVLGVAFAAASADTRLNDLTVRVGYLYSDGSPAIMPRLTRIEQKQIDMSHTLDRMEHKLDDLDSKQRRGR